MDEEELNDRIRRTLADASRPPEPPLDEMWENIEARAFGATPIVPIRSWRVSPWQMPAVAAAALLVGVGLGWYVAPRRAVTMPVATEAGVSHPAAPISSTNAVAAAEPGTSRAESVSTASREPAASPVLLATHTREVSPTSDTADAAAFRLADRLEMGGSHGAMSRYLTQTATLLASLPSDRSSAASDSVIATHAGELLTQTHLLLDSQAGSDPTLHRLLEDLELVLAQVARLRATRNGTDLQLIHQALTAHDVLPRVYDATVEAGATD